MSLVFHKQVELIFNLLKAILRTRVISTNVAPTAKVTTPEPILRDKKRERRVILISVVVLVSTVLVTAYCIKINWRKIK